MKTISLETEGLTLEKLLEEASQGTVVFLTSQGETRFALVQADEGDSEVAALRSNAEFMAYLSGCEERARSRPRKSLRQVREQAERETIEAVQEGLASMRRGEGRPMDEVFDELERES